MPTFDSGEKFRGKMMTRVPLYLQIPAGGRRLVFYPDPLPNEKARFLVQKAGFSFADTFEHALINFERHSTLCQDQFLYQG